VPPGTSYASPGAGIFGGWILDRFGLPAYDYTLDETTDPRAEWDPMAAPRSRLMWFCLGNRRITAAAYNDGFVELFYFESDPRWLNRYHPAGADYAGGFGFIREEDKVITTFYPRRPRPSDFSRVYGMGYFEKTLTAEDLRVGETVFAPAGDLPVLIHEVTIENLSNETRTLTYYDYWDLNVQILSKFLSDALFGGIRRRSMRFAPRFDSARGLLVLEGNKVWGKGGFPPGPRSYDPEPPSVFLASLSGDVSGFEFDQTRVFPSDTGWTTPERLGAIAGRPLAPLPARTSDYCLVLSTDLTLAPGEKKTLRFAFGYAKAKTPEEILDRIGDPDTLLADTTTYWKGRVPALKVGADDFLSREAAWDYYGLESLSLIDGYCETPFIPQGGNYLFRWGTWGATRDLAAIAQTLAYYDPGAAKDQIRMILKGQGVDGRFPYGMAGFGSKHEWYYRPSDFDLWVINAVVEYVYVTRDFAFLDEELPFYPKEKGAASTVFEHVRRSFDHLVGEVGTGRHGLVSLRLSDWNDEMTFLTSGGGLLDTISTYRKGESTLNTAMAVDILPGFADLARAHGDAETARRADEWAQKLRGPLKAQWTGPGWLIRSYSGGGKPFGKTELFLEPQIWALSADGVLADEEARILIGNIRERLITPSALGAMISDYRKGSRTTRPGEQEEGGIWFAMNGPAIVAIAKYDPDLAWQQLIRNSLAWHADTYPELWMGIWSGPDSFNSVYSDRPGQSWYQNTPLGGIGPQEFPVMNAHSHAQLLYALARLCGFNPTSEGFIIDPRVPRACFSFKTTSLSIEKTDRHLSGSFRFLSDGVMTISVRLPREWRDPRITVRVDNRRVDYRIREGFVEFSLPYKANDPVTWEVSRD
jgi:hypothetical protein